MRRSRPPRWPGRGEPRGDALQRLQTSALVGWRAALARPEAEAAPPARRSRPPAESSRARWAIVCWEER